MTTRINRADLQPRFLCTMESYPFNHLFKTHPPLLTLTLTPKSKSKKMRGQDPETKVLHELWSMMLHNFRSPPLSSLSSQQQQQRRPQPQPQLSPAAFGLLFIGISMALMLFGIVTFLIGFVLMPLVIMLVMLFYFAGIVSKLSEICRSILWPTHDCYKIAPVWN